MWQMGFSGSVESEILGKTSEEAADFLFRSSIELRNKDKFQIYEESRNFSIKCLRVLFFKTKRTGNDDGKIKSLFS